MEIKIKVAAAKGQGFQAFRLEFTEVGLHARGGQCRAERS
jgi:hypothetical protein